MINISSPSPIWRPVVSVHLNELVEASTTQRRWPQRIEQTMDQNLFRVASRKMREPGLDTDLSTTPSY